MDANFMRPFRATGDYVVLFNYLSALRLYCSMNALLFSILPLLSNEFRYADYVRLLKIKVQHCFMTTKAIKTYAGGRLSNITRWQPEQYERHTISFLMKMLHETSKISIFLMAT